MKQNTNMKKFQILLTTLIAVLITGSIVLAANQFPGDLNNWSTGDTIEADWANALEAKIGIDNSTVTTSIDYLIKNSASKLGSIYNITPSDGVFIVGDGSRFVGESGATARTSLGLGSIATLNSIDISDNTNLSVSATGLELSGDSIALTSGYAIPLSASTTNWESFYQTPSNRITAGTGLSWSSNTLNWSSSGLTWQGNKIGTAYGGTGQDTSGWTGLIRVSSGTWGTTTIDISDDTNLAVSGTLLDLTGDTLSVNEGTLTDGKLCKYVAGTGLDCNYDDQDTTYTAGRSLTLTGTQFDADAELYTDTKCIYIEDPTASDDLQSIWRTTQAITMTEIWCESDQTIDFDLQEDDGTPADIIGTDLQCAAGENSTTTFADANIAANSEIDLVVTSVANTPTWVSICWTYQLDD